MTDLVPTEDIERIVGARRLPAHHVARFNSEDQRTYILHSIECFEEEPDLRECDYSLSLDWYGLWGIDDDLPEDGYDWPEDTPIVVTLDEDGFLAPDAAQSVALIRPWQGDDGG